MSFLAYKPTIEEGDTVIVFLGHGSMLPVKIKVGNTHQTKYGALNHDTVIGRKFGSKIQCLKGYVHVLHPTSELWTSNLPHRTQILYSTDISMIILNLDLRPGSVVVEAGTGSGSLSHAILRTIAPDGFLHTFDFHEQRAEKAEQEFNGHGLGHLVKVTHQDVCQDGFNLDQVADAVFLDLPHPWDAIRHAKKSLKDGGRICSFSPCIEQVQKACDALTEHGFTDVNTLECLLRTFNMRRATMPVADLGDNNPEGTEQADETGDNFPAKKCKLDAGPRQNENNDQSEDKVIFDAALPQHVMTGHTGYLTFASIYPR